MKCYSFGLDIGGTKCAVSVGNVTDTDITILHREEFPTAGKSWQEVLAIYVDKIQALSETYEIDNIGVSCGGPLDSTEGIIQSPPNLPGWDDVPIVQYLMDAFNVPVHVQNDANASALAEAKYGAGRGARNVVFMTFGTGLGAGLVLDGKLYSGTNDNAGECHHHHHHADDVFSSWGKETPKLYSKAALDDILTKLDSGDYGHILRAKGIVNGEGGWLEFDYVPEEHEVRAGHPDYTGRLCVIGAELKEDKLAELFGL